jgi:hypothetical protein
MKKQLHTFLLFCSLLCLNSCATLTGGNITDSQKTPPKNNEPKRKIRPVALIVDCCFGVVPVLFDFATNAIYKPCKN